MTHYKHTLILWLCCCVAIASQAQPLNDNLCNAQLLPLNQACTGLNGDNTGASLEVGEANSCYDSLSHTVWYKFIAPDSGRIKITTSNSDIGSLLRTQVSFYQLPGGDCSDLADLSRLTCQLDTGENQLFSNLFTNPLLAGETYYIQVSGADGLQGNFCIEAWEMEQIIYVDASVNSATQDGMSWTTAFSDLQDALDTANARTNFSAIWIADGNYQIPSNNRPFSLKKGVELYGGFVGWESSLSDRIDSVWYESTIGSDSLFFPHFQAQTILDGESRGGVLDIGVGENGSIQKNIVVDGIVITNGMKSGENGGGIFISDTSPLIQHCVLTGNSTTGKLGNGGGVYNASNASPKILTSLFIDNHSKDGGDGGGYSNDGGQLFIAFSTFVNNSSTSLGEDARGGGIYCVGNQTIISHCFFKDNDSDWGGGVRMDFGSLILKDSQFENNSSIIRGGGAVGCDRGFANIIRSEFYRNKANHESEFGGAIEHNSITGNIFSCKFSENESNKGHGGGISNRGSNLVIKDCWFEKNKAKVEGGAIYNTSSTITLANATFSQNECDGPSAEGGAIYNKIGSISIVDCQFIKNKAVLKGGAISNNNLSNISVERSLFLGDSSRLGGAILNDRSQLEVSTSTFRNNQAQEGGAIKETGIGGSSSFTFCAFLSDTAKVFGGAIAIELNPVSIQNCLFEGNYTDTTGGAIWMEDEASLQLRNSTFYKNRAKRGGGIYQASSAFGVDIYASTFYQNKADSLGGGLYLLGNEGILKNSVFAENEGGQIFHSPTGGQDQMVSLGYNFISDTSNWNLIPHPTDQLGDSLNPLDVMLDTMGYYGGPLLPCDTILGTNCFKSIAPAPGSPLLGTGEPVEFTNLERDQRGFSRIHGSRNDSIDIGAFQSQYTRISIPLRPICAGDETFLPLGTIRIQDITGGAFAFAQEDTLALSLPDGISFEQNLSDIVCETVGLDSCEILSISDQQLRLRYIRALDTTFNEIQISGVAIRSDSAITASNYSLLRTGGMAFQYDHPTQDSLSDRVASIVPTIKLDDTNPYDNSFEGESSLWLPSDSSGSLWQRGIPQGEAINQTDSGQVWMTDLDASYPASSDDWLASPCFDFRSLSKPILSINYWSDAAEPFDGTVLQVSKNAGDSWETVGNTETGLNWYTTDAILSNPGNQTQGGQFGWTGRDTSWQQGRIVLNNLTGEDAVRFRFAFASSAIIDISQSNDGFAFDDFFIGERSKNILLEHATSQTSTQANEIIRSLTSNEIILIQYHIKPGDDFYDANPAGPRTRALYYGISEPSVVVVDGNDFMGQTTALTQISLDNSLLSEAFFNIVIDTTAAEEITITSSRKIEEELMVHIAVVEQIEGLSILRKFLPDPTGTSFPSWTANKTETFSPQWTSSDLPPPSIVDNYDSLHLVVFIQNRESKEIYQAELSPVWEGLVKRADVIGRENDPFSPIGNLQIFPNPTAGLLHVDFGQIKEQDFQGTIIDMRGRTVYAHAYTPGQTRYPIDLKDLASGMYYLELVQAGEIIGREKVVVQR